jgi:hypothetical protein
MSHRDRDTRAIAMVIVAVAPYMLARNLSLT